MGGRTRKQGILARINTLVIRQKRDEGGQVVLPRVARLGAASSGKDPSGKDQTSVARNSC
ncbi:hypothetical protein [Halodurantibacterium flavum]|uniref:hypothetical protein n=1 Tax=Halodurantibacterium flavum TaxID=1382802 RepID=UPI0036F43E2B